MKALRSSVPHNGIQTIANVVSTLVAVAALIYSSVSYQSTVHSSKRDQARRDWSEFLNMTGENSDLSFDFPAQVDADQKESDNRNRRIVFTNRMYFYMNSVVESDGIANWRSQIDIYLKRYGERECRLSAFSPHERLLHLGYSSEFASYLVNFYKKNCIEIVETAEQGRILKGAADSMKRFGTRSVR